MQRMQGLSRNERTQENEEETQEANEGIVNLPHFDTPQDDNERLLNYQYDFLVNGSQEAWNELWKLVEDTAGRMLAHICKQRKVFFTAEKWEEKRTDAAIYLLRRYKTKKDYCIKTNYPLHIWYAVKHVLDYRRKSDGLVTYVSDAELSSIIEKQKKGGVNENLHKWEDNG